MRTPEPSVPPRCPCLHAGQSPAPNLSSQPCLAPGSPGEAGGTSPPPQPPAHSPPPPAAHVQKFDSFFHKSTKPPMPILEAPGPLVTLNEAQFPGEGGNGGFHPEDRGVPAALAQVGSPQPQGSKIPGSLGGAGEPGLGRGGHSPCQLK